jgi:hypothetical protein
MAGNGTHGRGGRPGVPRRRPSPAVYRRRRLVAGILALLILAGLIAGGIAVANLLGSLGASGQPQTAEGSAEPQPSESQSAADEPPGSASPGPSASSASGEKVCDPSKVRVSAETNAHSYPAGRNPVLTMIVTNVGTEPCQLNVGTTQMEFIITSGPERVFSSKDCQVEPQDLMRTIEPGTTEQANFIWERNRTVPGCHPVESAVGAGTYQFQAQLGAIAGGPAEFELS